MGFSLDVSVPVLTVFLQGLLSFFSPCVLPLIPLYIGYLSGGAHTEGEDGKVYYKRSKVLINTVFFIVGVSFTFFLLGFGASLIGNFFSGSQTMFARIGGIIVVAFGLYQLGVFGKSNALGKERRLPFQLDKLAMSPWVALIMGFTFSFAWTPCVGPALSSVLVMAASANTKTLGILLIGVYTLGFVLPFLAVGIFSTILLDLFKKHVNVVKYTVKIGGVLMILMGIMMFTGKMNAITGYLSSTSTVAEDTKKETGEEKQEADAQEKEQAAQKDLPDAVDFTLTDQYGNSHTLSDYKGKTVLLNFWATWCGPCRNEMPDIQKVYEEYEALGEDSDVVILGIAGPDYGREQSEEGIIQFLEENEYTYPVLMDTGGKLFSAYGISVFPTTFMVTEEGKIFGYLNGQMNEDMMQSIIDQTKEGKK